VAHRIANVRQKWNSKPESWEFQTWAPEIFLGTKLERMSWGWLFSTFHYRWVEGDSDKNAVPGYLFQDTKGKHWLGEEAKIAVWSSDSTHYSSLLWIGVKNPLDKRVLFVGNDGDAQARLLWQRGGLSVQVCCEPMCTILCGWHDVNNC